MAAHLKSELSEKVKLTPEQLQVIATFRAEHEALFDSLLNALPDGSETSN